MELLCKIVLCLALLFSLANGLFAQTDNRDKGIELYKRGDNNIEAIRLLELASKEETTKNDGTVWNYLGMAYLRQNKNKESLKALERAAKLIPADSTVHSNLAYVYLLQNKLNQSQSEATTAMRANPKNVAAYYIRGMVNQKTHNFEAAISDADLAISISPDFDSAYLLKSNSLLDSSDKIWRTKENPVAELALAKQAAETLEICLQKCPPNSLQAVRENLNITSMYVSYFNNKINAAEISSVSAQTDPSNSSLQIISKPHAGYTDDARHANVQGIITLAVLFGADAKIKRIIVLRGLGEGLTEEAVKAASHIMFEPQKKDGKPVSIIREVTYSFSIH